MTNLAKAIAFATHCLKWTDARTGDDTQGLRIFGKRDGTPDSFNPDSIWELQEVLTEFLGKRYFIQINRGTSSLFHWRVIVAWQDGTDKSRSFDHAQAEGEDLWDCVFDACVQAAGMYR